MPYLTWTVTRTLMVSRSLLISAAVSMSNSLLLKPPAHSTLFDVVSTAAHMNANHWPTHPWFAPLWNTPAQHGILRIRDITLLESVQRRAARFVCNDYRYSTSVTTLLNQLEWPPLKECRQQARLTLYSERPSPMILPSLSHLSHPSRTTRTFDKPCFIPISTHTDVYKFAFIPPTILDWNSASLEFCTKSLQTPPGKVESHQ